MPDSLIGKGIYSLSDAARLTGIRSGRLKRWMVGYTFKYKGQRIDSRPIIAADLGKIGGEFALTFRDLIEARFLNAFREAGVSFPVIRIASSAASKLMDRSHPLSSRHFVTDGRDILAKIGEDIGDPQLLSLTKSQYEFRQVVSPSLKAGLEFDDYGLVERWWPLSKKKHVVIDPLRSFGAPIIDDVGVRTEILAAAAKAEKSISRAAAWYDVPARAVREAIEFEKHLAHRAA